MNIYKIIESVDEITEKDIEMETRFISKYSKRWFQIDKDEGGYCIYGRVCGDMPDSVTVGVMVKYWKTLAGIKRAIKGYVKTRGWGFNIIFPRP